MALNLFNVQTVKGQYEAVVVAVELVDVVVVDEEKQ